MGVVERVSGGSTTDVVESARQGGALPHTVDGTTLRTEGEALDAIATALSFPDWFGHNLDALYDCLTDLSWLPEGEHVLIWERPEVLRARHPEAYVRLYGVFADALANQPAGRRLRVILVGD